MNSLFIAHQAERYLDETLIQVSWWHRCTNVLPTDVRNHRWLLAFKQSSFSLIVQALQSHIVHVFLCAPL
jgi:hypothetical protein